MILTINNNLIMFILKALHFCNAFFVLKDWIKILAIFFTELFLSID